MTPVFDNEGGLEVSAQLRLAHDAGPLEPPLSEIVREVVRQLEGLGPLVVSHPSGAIARYRVEVVDVEPL